MRFVILFGVLFLATMIAFAFVGNALFLPVENDTASQDRKADPSGPTGVWPASEERLREPVKVDTPSPVARFVSTTDDSVADDTVDATPAIKEDPSAVASPSDLRVKPTAEVVSPATNVPRKQAAAGYRSQVQRQQKCRPPERRRHRCRLRR